MLPSRRSRTSMIGFLAFADNLLPQGIGEAGPNPGARFPNSNRDH